MEPLLPPPPPVPFLPSAPPPLLSLRRALFLAGGVVGVSILFSAFALLHTPSSLFPKELVVAPGMNGKEVAAEAARQGIVSNATTLWLLLRLSGTTIEAGVYHFDAPETVVGVAQDLARGAAQKSVRVTIPEGLSVREMAPLFAAVLPGFHTEDFLALALPREGTLFPDTYEFYPTATAEDVVTKLTNEFDAKTADLKEEAIRSGRSWEEVIILASILEDEVSTPSDRRIVAGILERRLREGMRLQIDATLGYVTGKGSLQLSDADLFLDSPYNTYRHDGLPPTPIANPGLDAIEAVLTPRATPYLFYLSDAQGVVHYAKTFEEHVANKRRYLK